MTRKHWGLERVGALMVLGISVAWLGACGSSGDATKSSGDATSSGAGAASGAGGSGGHGGNVATSSTSTTGGGGSGGSGPCASDTDCKSHPDTPACDTKTGECVECAPGSAGCAMGEYCDPSGSCQTGCGGDQDCDNGGGTPLVCDPNTHQCVGCVDDATCQPGSICQGSTCVPGCNDQHACAMGSVCCAGECYDESADPQHCGGCNACPAPAEAHADPICNGGVCGFGPCQPGFGDCNGDATDGCEADLGGLPACPCAPGAQSDCYEGPPGTENQGPCVGGKKTCNPDGIGYGPCVGQVLPAVDDCNNALDDDCNGVVNDGAQNGGASCTCVPASTQSCYDGPAGTQNIGICKDGTQTCSADGTAWGPCAGETLPGVEDCSTAGDENCNGQVNEAAAGCACAPGSQQACYGGPPGTENVGLCKGGTQTCNADGKGWGACAGQVLPQQETCFDAADDDCDGQVNEGGPGCLCTPNQSTSCYDGPPGTSGVGICKSGSQQCNALGTQYGPCNGEVVPQPETCATPVDDNCNGQINEGGVGCVCAPGATQACYDGPAGTLNIGICKAGTQMCNAGGTAWGACQGEVLPKSETCSTPTDDNCNGQTNEGGTGCVCAPNAQQSCYDGPAGTLGVGVCSAGTKTCNGQGTAWSLCQGEQLPQSETCNTPWDDNCNGQVNEGGAGCVCLPGSTKSCYDGPAGTVNVGICSAGTETCNAAGTAWGACTNEVTPYSDSCATPDDEDCNGSNVVCPASQDCYAKTGTCVNPCDPAVLGTSYVGCEYYPTVTTNDQLLNTNTFHFAVAVSNTGSKTVNVTITRGAVAVASGQVAANSVKLFNLPWVYGLLQPGGTVKSTNAAGSGAYHLVADRPVTVYQYNPIEYAASGVNTYTNDASLLLPVNAWTGNYRVAARNSWSNLSGFYAVVASQDNTSVTLGPSPTGTSVRSGAGVAANGTGSVVLNKGDVLQVLSYANGNYAQSYDVTGTLVTANKPVQVIGGHDCTFIPSNTGYCDHLEESMFPIETLSKTYIVTAPLIAVNTPKAQRVRIIATQPSTTLVYDPPQAGAPASIATAGSYVELPQTANAYKVTASAKILVAQYMLGQDAGGNAGDPAMALAVATEQYRTSYLFHAPTNYQSNFVNVTAPTGSTVVLDGAAIPAGAFSVIGATGFSQARVALSNAGNGNHSVTSAAKVGISVYGYGQYTSYWYPGGLDLQNIPQ